MTKIRNGSFNGAATFQPRKRDYQHWARSASPASMGPRPFSRGNAALPHRTATAIIASMGPRPFSRGNCNVRYGGDMTIEASMGPRPFSRGNQETGRNEVSGWAASMGPRPFSRGNEESFFRVTESVEASMGPRPFSRGNGMHSAAAPKRPHCFNGAATFQPRKPVPEEEIWLGMQGFNGAATFQPRKHLGGLSQAKAAGLLQWGRDLSAAETGYRHPKPIRTSKLQWGRDLSAAETSRSAPQRPSGTCFNGAATFQPRKPAQVELPSAMDL